MGDPPASDSACDALDPALWRAARRGWWRILRRRIGYAFAAGWLTTYLLLMIAPAWTVIGSWVFLLGVVVAWVIRDLPPPFWAGDDEDWEVTWAPPGRRPITVARRGGKVVKVVDP